MATDAERRALPTAELPSELSAEPSGKLSGDFSGDLGGSLVAGPSPAAALASEDEARRKRIAYFMAFRLVLLAAFTLLATYTTWLASDHEIGVRDWLTWATIAAGYVSTLVFAWSMRPSVGALSRTFLDRMSIAQTGFDIVLAAATVLVTGGVDSGLVFLFPVAVLGAATMGDRRLIWASATIAGLFYLGLCLVQFVGLLQPFRGALAPIDSKVLIVSLLRTTAAIGLVATLSGYLNSQLLTSVSQVGGLRALNENIVRSLNSGLLTVDQNGWVLFANPTAHELLGHTEALTGMDSETLMPGLRAHLEGSGKFRNRFELDATRFDDERPINLGLTCSPLLDDNGRFLGHVVNFQDVSEIRQMERDLRRSERLAALGGLAASVAHEVRNPLAAIAGCAELLEDVVDSDEDQRLINVIRRESVRLNNIVTELLDYTRPRPLQRTAVELGQALHDLTDAFEADPNFAEIDLVTAIPSEPVRAKVDIALISQVLWNLVRNGAQAMDGHGRLEIGLLPASDHVSLWVKDHGHGIPEADLDRVFEPFFSTKHGGSGIGLALVHRIVEDHGGSIRVQSTVDEGTQFDIRLPV